MARINLLRSSNGTQQTRHQQRKQRNKSNRDEGKQAAVVVDRRINYVLLVLQHFTYPPPTTSVQQEGGTRLASGTPGNRRFRARFPKPPRLLLTIPTAAAKATVRKSVNVRSQRQYNKQSSQQRKNSNLHAQRPTRLYLKLTSGGAPLA